MKPQRECLEHAFRKSGFNKKQRNSYEENEDKKNPPEDFKNMNEKKIFFFSLLETLTHYNEQRIHIFAALQNDNVGNVCILNIEKYGCPPCVHIHIHCDMYQNNT